MQNNNNVNQTIRITWDKTENPYKNNLFHKFLHNIFFFSWITLYPLIVVHVLSSQLWELTSIK